MSKSKRSLRPRRSDLESCRIKSREIRPGLIPVAGQRFDSKRHEISERELLHPGDWKFPKLFPDFLRITQRDIATYLEGQPALRAAILWEVSNGQGIFSSVASGTVVPYDQWPYGAQLVLQWNVINILTDGEPNLLAAPQCSITLNGGGQVYDERFDADYAWYVYIAYLAQSIAVDYGNLVKWKLADLSSDTLAVICDSRQMFNWSSADNGYHLNFIQSGFATPGDPVRQYRFLVANNLIGDDSTTTLALVLDWCRNNLVHFYGGYDPANVQSIWNYQGFAPVETVLAGTVDPRIDPANAHHYTAGCWGTTGFLRLMLRTLNMACLPIPQCNHATPHFIQEQVYLSHGDDPYTRLMVAEPAIPINSIFVDPATYQEWFGPDVANVCPNIERRPVDLSLQTLPNFTLECRCQDIADGITDPSESSVYEEYTGLYTVADLEAMNFWERIDAKIETLGGCPAVALLPQ